jgi:hypothetical protein
MEGEPMRFPGREPLRNSSLALVGGLALLAGLLPGPAASAGDKAGAAWKVAHVERLPGLAVALSEPVLVARSKGYLWFPTLVRLEGGDLLALMSNYADVHTNTSTSQVAWSTDGGLTWGKTREALYSDSSLRLPDGDRLLLPYYLYPQEGGLGAPCQRISKGKREIQVVKDGVLVTGWPRPDQSLEPKLGLAGFVLNGQTVELKEGGYLATLYGHFKDTKRYSLVAAESKDGRRWQVRSVVADENCPLTGAEGPCEAALCRLRDGRLLCVFRLASNVAYGQVWSRDEGKTWSAPVTMAQGYSVQPSLAVLKDGTVVLSGGRPGLFAWFNRDGTGRAWREVDIQAHHNRCQPKEPIEKANHTSSYTEVIALDESNLLYVYDRIPHGWAAIPKDSADTNSVWVVRLTLHPVK